MKIAIYILMIPAGILAIVGQILLAPFMFLDQCLDDLDYQQGEPRK